jgi:6-phosphofructo-2-kinase/fructose-2,6-biphosphatase 2
MTVKQIIEEMPEDFAQWQKDPFHYRFLGGESILDMNKRLCEVVLEIERLREPVVVVSHLSTIQSLIAYFTSKDPNAIPFISVPRHSVVRLVPSIYGWALDILLEDQLPPVTKF